MDTTSNTMSNPLAQQFNVVVSIPQSVKIKLVDASLLNDFEIWMYLSTLLLNICTGFWVSYVQNTNSAVEKLLCWISISFSAIFLFTLITAIIKRGKMTLKSKEIQLSTAIANPGTI